MKLHLLKIDKSYFENQLERATAKHASNKLKFKISKIKEHFIVMGNIMLPFPEINSLPYQKAELDFFTPKHLHYKNGKIASIEDKGNYFKHKYALQ